MGLLLLFVCICCVLTAIKKAEWSWPRRLYTTDR